MRTILNKNNLKVLVLGYGSREHALAWKLAQSPRVSQVYVAPGNAGTAQFAVNIDISDEDIETLVEFACNEHIDLTVVGTNDPLVLGVVDAFQAKGLPIFGPNQTAARLESSKAFAKQFMQRHNIPTPAFAVFREADAALRHLESLPADAGVVVKLSGLGKYGQGVTVCDTLDEAREAVNTYLVEGFFGEVADEIVIEERVRGDEVSMFALSDGTQATFLLPVRDHKRINDGDEGPNTGGVGAYGPPPDISAELIDAVMANVIQPTITGMCLEGAPYVGVLFTGLILTETGYQVLEYNARFGNPEALVIMSLLENDLVDLIDACLSGSLREEPVRLKPGAAAAVVITSPGYPDEEIITGLPISGIGNAEAQANTTVYHHGTDCVEDQLVTSRGRVLAVAATGEDLPQAVNRAYAGVSAVSFSGAHYRTDIGVGVK